MPSRVLLVATTGFEGEVPLAAQVEVVSPLVVIPRFREMKQAISRLARFRTVALTSAHAVDALVGALRSLGHDVRALFGLRLAAVGSGTAARLGRYGLSADIVAEGGGAALARELLDMAAPDLLGPVLHPRALDGRPELAEVLRSGGVEVEVVSAYETLPDTAALKGALLRHHEEAYAAFAFASPRGARALLDAWGGITRLGEARIGAIGPTTQEALLEAGLREVITPDVPSVSALIAMLLPLIEPLR